MRGGNGQHFKWFDAVRRRVDLRASSKLVYSYLLDRAESVDNPTCYPAVPTIAEACNLSERMAKYALRQLTESRLVTITRKAHGLDPRYRSNIYRLADPTAVQSVASLSRATDCTAQPSRGAESRIREVQDSARQTCNGLPHNKPSNPQAEQTNSLKVNTDWDGACKHMASADLRTDEFREAWLEWVKYRGRAKLKPQTVKRQIARLEKFGHDHAIASIEQSITNSWAGLFEPKSSGTTAGRTGTETRRRDRAQLEFAEADLGVQTL